MAWIRRQNLDGTEEGRKRWHDVQTWVSTPPAPRVSERRVGATPPPVPIMSAEQQAAAFAATVSMGA